MRTAANLAGWTVGGFIMLLAVLACFERNVLTALNIVFDPNAVLVQPGPNSVTAKVVWLGSRVLDAEWSVDDAGLKSISGASCSPASGEMTTVSFTGSAESTISAVSDKWLNSNATGEWLPVSARFIDPNSWIFFQEDIWVKRRAYLPLIGHSARLDAEIKGLRIDPSFRGWGWFSAEARVITAPEAWRYTFAFELGAGEKAEFPELPVTVGTDGKGAGFPEIMFRFDGGKVQILHLTVFADPVPGTAAKALRARDSVYLSYNEWR